MKNKKQILAFFSEKTQVSQSTANQISDLLYNKGLDIKSLDRVMWRLEDYVRTTKMASIFDLLATQEIEAVIDEMIAEDNACRVQELQRENDGVSLAKNFTAWGFSEFAETTKTDRQAGDIVDIQIMRTGKWNHPVYGEFEVTEDTLKEVKQNFDNNLRGIRLAVDENHEPNHKALAWYNELYQVSPQDLYAKLELTQKGADLLNEGAYKYFSPEIVFYKQDEESGKPITNMLVGGAFTNRPFFKSMQPLMASEDGQETGETSEAQGVAGSETHDNFYIFFDLPMKTLLDLLAKFSDFAKINKTEKAALEKAFSELDQGSRSDAITAEYNKTLAKFSEDETVVTPPPETKEGGETQKTETVEASEKNVTISASELESLRTIAAAFAEAQKTSVKSFAETKFSELAAKGNVLPKHKDAVLAFAETLERPQAEALFSVLGGMKAFNDTETGSGQAPAVDPVEASKFSEAVQFAVEKFGFSEDVAKAMVTAELSKK